MKLSNRQQYLSIDFAIRGITNRLQIHSDSKSALGDWQPNRRVSPIYPVLDAGLDCGIDEPLRGEGDFFFFGPVAPWRIRELIPRRSSKKLGPSESGLRAWLCLGARNVILFSGKATISKAILKWLRKEAVSAEQWHYDSGSVQLVSQTPEQGLEQPEKLGRTIQDLHKLSQKTKDYHLRSALRELEFLAESTSKRCVGLGQWSDNPEFPLLGNAVQIAIAAMNNVLEDAFKHRSSAAVIEVLALNSALGHLSSQALAATPSRELLHHPIHHSLFGTGTVNLALLGMYQFVFSRIGQRYIPERFEMLIREDVGKLPSKETILAESIDLLGRTVLSIDINELENRMRFQLAYLNDPEHFLATRVSVCAPTTVIEGSNCAAWSLLPLSHEVSHSIVRRVLDLLLPLRPDEFKEALENTTRPIAYLGDELRLEFSRMLSAIRSGDQTRRAANQLNDPEAMELFAVWQKLSHEMEEIGVHIFDSLYFSNNDSIAFVKRCWRSLSVLPEIEYRIEEFLLRTLCAVMAVNLEDEHVFPMTYRKTFEGLVELEGEIGPWQKCAGLAKLYLEEHWLARLENMVDQRLPLIEMMRCYVFSQGFASEFASSSSIRTKRLKIGEGTIGNPFFWLQCHATGSKPDAAQSAWILQMLAYQR